LQIILTSGDLERPGINRKLNSFKVLVTPMFFYDEACFAREEEANGTPKNKMISTKLMEKSSILNNREDIRDEVNLILRDPFYKSEKVLKMF
jgi:hypothetical protein